MFPRIFRLNESFRSLLQGGGELEDGTETGFVRERERDAARRGGVAVYGGGDQFARPCLRLVFETEPVEPEIRRKVLHGLVEGTVAVEVAVHVGLVFLDPELREAFRLLRGERDLARKIFHGKRLIEPKVPDDLRRYFAGASGCAVDERADRGAEDADFAPFVIDGGIAESEEILAIVDICADQKVFAVGRKPDDLDLPERQKHRDAVVSEINGEIVFGIHLEAFAFQKIVEGMAEAEASAGRGIADRYGSFNLKHEFFVMALRR